MTQIMVALSQIEQAAQISEDDAQKNSEISKETQDVVSKIKNTIESVSGNMAQIQNEFAKSVSLIQQSGVDSKENLQDAKDVLQDAKNIKRSIKYLKKTLRKIELTIVQTAALSINGSVEAMRVGELGEGFSVVSNDIRNLAENSEQSLDQINDIVDNLEDETEGIIEVIQAMQTLGIKEADDMVVLAVDMSRVTDDIGSGIADFHKVSTKLEAISNALTESQVGAEQTLTAAQLSFDNSKESKIAAEHIIELSSDMAEHVSELIEVAALLKDN